MMYTSDRTGHMKPSTEAYTSIKCADRRFQMIRDLYCLTAEVNMKKLVFRTTIDVAPDAGLQGCSLKPIKTSNNVYFNPLDVDLYRPMFRYAENTLPSFDSER